MPSSTKYKSDPVWADVQPLPVEDGGETALATIAYTEEYREAMAYLRAVMAATDHSERVLDLTAHIIRLNPAHYTVWLYRAKTLEVLKKPIGGEIDWLNEIALRHIKNYQIWHHRQTLLTRLKRQLEVSKEPFDPTSEMDFLNEMFEKDTKNYHVWSYRQWLVKTFGLWDHPGELSDAERWLHDDVMNNSAWNHRWFLCFGRSLEDPKWKPDDGLFDREIKFAQDAIDLEPRNESPWNYLRAVITKSGRSISTLEDFTAALVPSLDDPKTVKSEFAVSMLADVYESQGKREQAAQAYELLSKKVDQIRHNYWQYRKDALGLTPSNTNEQSSSISAAS